MKKLLFAVNDESLDKAASVLRAGGIVAFPTETYYGLAVDPFQEAALERLFQIKQRPQDRPVLVLVQGLDQVLLLASEFPEQYLPLVECFWPGPLTLVCPVQPGLPRLLTGGGEDIGLRHSSCTTANRLLAVFKKPITATSANISGMPAAVSAAEIVHVFGDKVDLILDGGFCPGGSGSSLVGFRKGTLYCIREGKIPFVKIQACIKEESI